MKRATGIFSIIVAIFVAGCQDQTATGPVSNNAETVPIHKSQVGIGSIALNGILPQPWSDIHFTIDGRVDYATARVPGTLNQFDIGLSMAAHLTVSKADQPPLSVAGNSTHRVSVTEEGVAFLELPYLIQSRSDRLTLVLEYQITQDNIEVTRMWLDFME